MTRALTIGGPMLRSLDALHLSSATMLQPRLTAFVVYDKRLRSAAEAVRLSAVAPGA